MISGHIYVHTYFLSNFMAMIIAVYVPMFWIFTLLLFSHPYLWLFINPIYLINYYSPYIKARLGKTTRKLFTLEDCPMFD